MLGACLVGRDVGQIDIGLEDRRQLDLGDLHGFSQPLGGHGILAQVHSRILLELLDHVLHQLLVHVPAAELGIAAGGLDLEDPLTDLHDGHVQGPATEVEDHQGIFSFFIQTVGQGRRRGLVDDPDHVQTGDSTRVLGGLSLVVIEVGGHGDHRFFYGLSKIGLGVLLDLSQDGRGYLLRSILLPTDLDPVVGAHLPFYSRYRAFRVGYHLPPRGFSHQLLSILGVGDIRGERLATGDYTGALGAGDHSRLATDQDRSGGVAGSEIYANNLRQVITFLRLT